MQEIQHLMKNEKNPLGLEEHFPAIIRDQVTEVYLLSSTSTLLGNTCIYLVVSIRKSYHL